MKIRNLILAIKDQLPVSRFLKNLKKGHLYGLFHIRSHTRADGSPKVMYNTKATAQKSADSLMKKKGQYFSNYKCLFCDGYHLGKNRDNPNKEQAA